MLALEGGGGGIGDDGGADKIFAVFFDGVLLSQKTHGLLLASVSVFQRHLQAPKVETSVALKRNTLARAPGGDFPNKPRSAHSSSSGVGLRNSAPRISAWHSIAHGVVLAVASCSMAPPIDTRAG